MTWQRLLNNNTSCSRTGLYRKLPIILQTKSIKIFLFEIILQASSATRDGSMVGRACLQVGQDLDHYYYDYHDDHIDHYDHIEMMMIIIMIILKDKNDTWGSTQARSGRRSCSPLCDDRHSLVSRWWNKMMMRLRLSSSLICNDNKVQDEVYISLPPKWKNEVF